MLKACSIIAGAVVTMMAPMGSVQAEEAVAVVHTVTADGVGQKVGEIRFEDDRFGLLVKPDLEGLTAGPHAAHVYEKAACGCAQTEGKSTPAGAAGGHYYPEQTGRHEGPYGNGHLGDLPNLIVEEDGAASIPVLAPRLKSDDVSGRALMIHAAADRYAGHS